MDRAIKYLHTKITDKTPILWDRLVLIVTSNIFIAGAIVIGIDEHDWHGSIFLLAIGILGHIHFWRYNRL